MTISQIHGLSKMRLAFPAIPALPCHGVASAPLVKPMRRHASASSLSPALPPQKQNARYGGWPVRIWLPPPFSRGGPWATITGHTTVRHCKSHFGATPQFCESVTPSPRLRNRGSSYSVCCELVMEYLPACVPGSYTSRYLFGKGGRPSSRSSRSKGELVVPIAT